MNKKKWLLMGVALTTSLVLMACSSSTGDDEIDEDIDVENPEIIDEKEHVDDFDIDFQDNDEFEELDEDFTDLPEELDDEDVTDPEDVDEP